MNKNEIKPFKDRIVIYRENNRWVAHSIETDQIGVDEDIVIAIVDLVKAVNTILKVASKDNSIKYKRKAPKKVISKIDNAVKLPDDVYRIACDILNKKWPQKDVTVTITPKNNRQSFSITSSQPFAYC